MLQNLLRIIWMSERFVGAHNEPVTLTNCFISEIMDVGNVPLHEGSLRQPESQRVSHQFLVYLKLKIYLKHI